MLVMHGGSYEAVRLLVLWGLLAPYLSVFMGPMAKERKGGAIPRRQGSKQRRAVV
jgi:hypothetical protein